MIQPVHPAMPIAEAPERKENIRCKAGTRAKGFHALLEAAIRKATATAVILVAFGVGAAEAPEKIRVYATFYCATGPGCSKAICGGNKTTANGSDATKAGGFAADPAWCPYGTRIRLQDGTVLIHDDNFGKQQRARDRKLGRWHIDIRVAGKTHKEVQVMGAGWIEVQVLRGRP